MIECRQFYRGVDLGESGSIPNPVLWERSRVLAMAFMNILYRNVNNSIIAMYDIDIFRY